MHEFLCFEKTSHGLIQKTLLISNKQSFWEAGFPATAFFERNGPIADPKYHNSGDLVYREGYDFEQLRASTKAMMASVFEVADVKL